MIDFVIYGDTDSNFFSIEKFIDAQKESVKINWYKLSDSQKINYAKRISRLVVDYVNECSFVDIQLGDFNSQVKDFKIVFEQEIIARTALFCSKKRYGLAVVEEDGVSVNKIQIKGLEIIRSDTPVVIKPLLKDFLEMVLHGASDRELSDRIEKHKQIIYTETNPYNIAVNRGANNLAQYEQAEKAIPWHIKGAINFNTLIDGFNLTNYRKIVGGGEKVRTVYLKKNMFDMEVLSFITWPEEFSDLNILIDNVKMADRQYVKKIEDLLSVINKQHCLQTNMFDIFFGDGGNGVE
jgi:DNA polymerase elongation subunit (family B)